MNNILSKVSVPTAVDTKNKFSLPMTCFTTANFFVPRVVYCHETVPGESWHNDVKVFTRLSPLVKPLVADINIKTRYFFVPFRVVMKNWNNFLSQSPACGQTEQDYIPTICRFSDRFLTRALINSNFSSLVSDTSDDFDFYDIDQKKRKFTDRGRLIYSILLGLGYNFQLNSTDNNWFSALPLLCYYKVWRDWYRSTEFDDSFQTDRFFYPPYDQGGKYLIASDLQEIFLDICKMYFEKDYFTIASLNPVGTNQRGSDGAYSLLDITAPANSSLQGSIDNTDMSNGTPSFNTEDSSGRITKYSIDAINALSDLVKRHDLAGIQPFNRILAEYGVSLTDEQINYSTYIGESVTSIDIADVMSTSYSDDTVLGEYGGKGIGFDQKHLRFSTNEFGIIIGIMTVVPRFVYSHGYNRLTRHINRFDFFTPEIEHLGTQPIECGEFANDDLVDDDVSLNPSGIFGFTSRYAEYKNVSHDIVSGNFFFNSKKKLYNGWFLDRVIDYFDSDEFTISEDFIRADYRKLSQPFVQDGSSVDDPFNIFVRNNVSAILPMHRMFDDYQWSNENDNPHKVSINIHGVQKT